MAVFTGTFAGDIFTVAAGDNRYDALGGNDIAVFDFKLTDAVVSYAGNQVIVDTATSHTVLTGFQTYRFTDGTVEENDGEPLVADLFYYANNHDVWRAHVDADAHYASAGWREGRNPSAFFDTGYYLASNPDVAAAGINPLVHYDRYGWQEGRLPSLVFDQQSYLINNPGLAASGINPLAHFLRLGGEAGTGNPATLVSGAVNAAGFDATFYLLNNPDVAASGIDPYQHFQTFGWKEGRNPNAFFDTRGYLATYTDVSNSGGNPLDHYNTFGWQEGRNPSPGFDTGRYLDANPDVKAAGINPLTHYLTFGVNEGRAAIPEEAGASVAENTIAVLNLTAADADGPAATFAIVGGADAGLFTIVGNQLRFIAPPNFEAPADAGANNFYDVQVRASDGINVPTIQSIAVALTNVNEAPAGADGAVTTAEDTAYVLKTTDFGFGDPDAGASLAAVRITGLPGAGTLTLNNVAVTLNQDIAVAQIAAGLLVFTPAANANGASYAQIGFAVSDGALLDPTPSTLTINVTAVNDAPVAVNDTLGATEDQAGVLAVNLLANDTDLDGPAPAVTSFALVTGGAGSASAPGTIVLANGAALSVDNAGHVTLTQNGAYDHLNAGETAQIIFNYQMTDGGTPAYAADAQAVITVTGSNDQVDLDLNFGNAGDDRNAGLFDNVTPAQLVFGVAATGIADAEDKLSSVSITITAPQGGSVNAGEALGIAPDTLALVSSLLGFIVEVSGNGGQSLTISAPSGQFFTVEALESLLEHVTYAINQSDFSFNASDRALSVTVTDFSTGATSDTALLTLDMRADVTATAGQNAFTGGNLSDLARGGAGDDVVAGGAGDDALVGGADNDTLTGGSGNDTIVGNDATVVRSGATFNVGGISGAAPNAGESDRAVYSGASTEYVVTHDLSGSYTVADQVAGRDGTDTLWGIETIDFAGGASLQLAPAIKVLDASGSVLLAIYRADQLDQAVAFANGAGGANIIELDAAAGSFSAGAWPVIISEAVTIKAVNGGPATISAGANSAFVINESAVDLAGDVVRLERLSINGTGAANTVGIDFRGTYGGSSDGAINVIGTSVSNFGRVGLLINGGGTGLSVSVGDDASTLGAESATFAGSGGANPLLSGTGDIVFFEFTGNALLRNVAVTGNSASADNGIQISGFQDGVGSANNVLTEIGNVRLENVSVNGTYQMSLVHIRGYNDMTGLDFANVNLGALTGTAAGWAALFIDGAPQGGAYAADGTAGGSIDGTVDVTGVTVSGGIFGTTPNFVALGSKQIVVNGTLTDDSIVGTSAHEAFTGLAGNDVIATGGGNDLVQYNVGDGQDTATDNGGFDTLALINVDATQAASATAASWTITNTGTTLSVDTDAAGTIDEVAATGFEALSIQLGNGGDTVMLDGNLGGGGSGLFAITVNGGLGGAEGADIVDARTLSSATGIVFNGGAGSDRFVSSNAGGTDTFNGGADGVTGDTVDYSAVSGGGVTVNLSASGVNSTGAGNDTLINVENVIGTNQADTFTGSSDNNMFDGRGGRRGQRLHRLRLAVPLQCGGSLGGREHVRRHGRTDRYREGGHQRHQLPAGRPAERRRLRLGTGGDGRGHRRRGHPDRVLDGLIERPGLKTPGRSSTGSADFGGVRELPFAAR